MSRSYILLIVIVIAVCWWIFNIRSSSVLLSTVASGSGNQTGVRSSHSSEDNPYRLHPERLIEEGNVAIEFWGRTVDENDQPVAGVVVKYSAAETGHLDWKSHERKGQIISDIDGSLHIMAGRAWVFSIDAVEKDGHKYIKGKSDYIYTGDNDLFIPDKNKPQRLVLVREDKMQTLLRYHKSLKLPWDGQSVHINLDTGEPDPQGNMIITMNRVLIQNPRLYKWGGRIEMRTGGIQFKKDFAPDVAPVAGYHDRIEAPEGSGTFAGLPVFWIKTVDDKYARVELFFDEDDKPRQELSSIQSWLNPEAGNRILTDKSFQP